MRPTDIDVQEHRETEHDIAPLLLERWSPRAMSGEALSDEELGSVLEAARWAPSSFNAQPWLFLYARRGGPHWPTFFDLIFEGNQKWAQDAAVLMVILSRRTFERNGKPARTHSFDAGAAWQNLALQAAKMDLVAHAMQGFDYDAARKALAVPEEFEVEAMVALGRPGRIEDLPEPMQAREKPSGRKAIEEIAWEGGFQTREEGP